MSDVFLGFTVGQVAAAQSVAHSIISNRKTSTVSDQRSKDKHHAGATAKTAALGSSAPGEGSSQVCAFSFYCYCINCIN